MTRISLNRSRWLAMYEEGIPLHWQSIQGELLLFVQNSSVLSLLESSLIISLQAHPDDPLFDVEESLVAVEVTGRATFFEEEIFLQDQEVRDVVMQQLNINCTVEEIKNVVRSFYGKYQENCSYKWYVKIVGAEEQVMMRLYFLN